MKAYVPIFVLALGVILSVSLYLHFNSPGDKPHTAPLPPIQSQKAEYKKPPKEKTVSAEDKKKAEDLFKKGYELMGKNRHKEATALFSEAIEINPSYAAAYRNRAIIKSWEDSAAALEDINKAIKLEPTSAEAHNIRSGIFQTRGQFDLSVADATKAIELDPKNHNYYNTRGSTYSNFGRFEEAIKDFTAAIELKNDAVLARINRAKTFYAVGKYQEGDTDLDDALRFYPQGAAYIGQVKEELQRYKK